MNDRWLRREFEGWGRYRRAVSLAAAPVRADELPGLLQEASAGSTIAFGAGRSYGDSALNDGRRTLETAALDRARSFDRERGIFACEAGISLAQILDVIVPDGWFLPVTPGTRFPTIGGCLAADVHGKNHHVAGSLARHVRSFDLLLADGATVTCSRDENPDLFAATAGGIGLTGIITRVELQLQPIENTFMFARHIRTGSLAETMEMLAIHDEEWPYTVAWLDSTAGGGALGRGEVILGRHAALADLPVSKRARRLRRPEPAKFAMPVTPPVSLVTPATIRAFNEIYYRRGGPEPDRAGLESAYRYFYPLDAAAGWNRCYGPRGFVQYQFVVPEDAAEATVREMLRACQSEGHPSALTVLKRFGDGEGWLSFPAAGWTLALDIPVRPGLLPLLDRFDRQVADSGGRVYLAKDARLAAETFREMYPDYPRWLAVKRRVDPECRFSSDQSRRLRIDDDVRAG
ncbi:MAG: Decaprenylphosphoryl-beta-D-ribose oxidase [Calditrichaeota bacterium]|nr:Decaprenylphosphoryl-beta-D-ribose oxidase [Calditrichota bacterium]